MPLKTLGSDGAVISEIGNFTRGLGFDLIPIDGGESGQGDFGVATDTVITAASLVDQTPAGINQALQVEFGDAQPGPEVSLDANGAITFHVVDDWDLTFRFQFGRSTFTGNAIVFTRALLNGAQAGVPFVVNLDDGGYDIPVEIQVTFRSAVNDVITAEIIRDPAGVDQGRLRARASDSWGVAPSARLFVRRSIVVTEPNPASTVFKI